MTRSRYLRQKVYERDKGVCASCGRYDPKWEADHIVELCFGGKDTVENAQTLCRQHHKTKTSGAAPVRAKADRLRERHELMKARTAPPKSLRAKEGGMIRMIIATLILLSGCAAPEPLPPIKGRYCNPDNPPGICCAQHYTPEQRLHLRDQCP